MSANSAVIGTTISAVLSALVISVVFLDGGSAFPDALFNALALSLPLLISSTVYFAGRWMSDRWAARRSAVPRTLVQPLSSDGTAALHADQLTLPSRIDARKFTTYQMLSGIRSWLVDLCRIFLIAALGLLVLDLVGFLFPIQWPFPIPLLLIGLLFHDWTRIAAPVTAIAIQTAKYFGLLTGVNSVFYLSFGDYFLYALYLTAALACGLAAPLITHGRRARILLLRPFGQSQMTSALKRVVRKHIGTLGTVITLSDRDYKPSTAMLVLRFIGGFAGVAGETARHLFGPIVRPSLRLETVWNDATYRTLQRILGQTFRLDLKSAYAGNQAFNVASSDEWWRSCIDLMMNSSDLILMDISRVSEGSTWEIAQLGRRNLQSRTVFIVQEPYAKQVGSLASLFPGGACPAFFVFREKGTFLDQVGFSAALDKAAARAK